MKVGIVGCETENVQLRESARVIRQALDDLDGNEK